MMAAAMIPAGVSSAQCFQCEADVQTVPTMSPLLSKDYFGTGIDVDGSRMIIGASRRDHLLGDEAGSAFIFGLESGHWVEKLELEPFSHQDNSGLGESVSISGEWAIASAPSYFLTADGVDNVGAVHIFQQKFSTTDPPEWNEVQVITASDAQNGRPIRRHACLISSGHRPPRRNHGGRRSASRCRGQ